MSRIVRSGPYLALFLAAAGVTAAAARRPAPPGPPAADFPGELDLGEQRFGSLAVGRLRLTNAGGSDLVADRFATSCSCAGVEEDDAGTFRRVDAVRLPPGQSKDLVVRVAVSAQVGTPQTVHAAFRTNDPARPAGEVLVSVPRVTGGVHCDPPAVAFGEVPPGGRPVHVVKVYGNAPAGRAVESVRSLAPGRFTAVLGPAVPDPDRTAPPAAGPMVATVTVTPAAGYAGPLAGGVELRVRGDGGRPDRISVVGEVVFPVICRPDTLVLPRAVAGQPAYDGVLALSAPVDKVVSVNVEAAPAGVTAAAGPDMTVRVRAAADSPGGPVRLRVRTADGQAHAVEVPVTVRRGE